MVRQYSSTAVATTLSGSASPSDPTITVASTSGFPVALPYTLSIDADNASKELVEVTAAAGTTLTVTRGIDGTSGVSHSLGAAVRHDHSARDFREAQEHIDASDNVHGVTGDVVGTTDVQVVTNKDLTSATNTFPSTLATDTEVAAVLTNLTNHSAAVSGVHGVPGGEIVGTTTAQTLTNKTLQGPSVTLAQVAISGSSFIGGSVLATDLTDSGNTFPTSLATLTGAQTLTNKTLVAPVVEDSVTVEAGASVDLSGAVVTLSAGASVGAPASGRVVGEELSGTHSVGSVSSGGTVDATITFDPDFTGTPSVVAQVALSGTVGYLVHAWIISVSAAQVVVRVRNDSGGAVSPSLHWHARYQA